MEGAREHGLRREAEALSRPVAATTTFTRADLSGRTAFERLRGPVGVGLGLTATAVAVALRDPHAPGSWGFCPFLVITGWYCPGCGGLRAVYDLAHGDWAAAVSSNVYGLVLCAGLGLAWFGWLVSASLNRVIDWHRLVPRHLGLVILAVTVVFTVARNIPAGEWLAP